MATTRFGHLDDFTLKNSKVGIGTSDPTEALEVIGGSRSQDIAVTGIATLTSSSGFQNTKTSYVENVNITGGESGTLSGEIVIGAGLTMSVGTGATTGQGSIKSLKVSNTFTPPIGGINDRPSAPQPGAIFYNKDFRTIEYWDGNFWRQVDNTTTSGRGVWMGGNTPTAPNSASGVEDNIEFINLNTSGSFQNFGDLTIESRHTVAMSSHTRGLIKHGYDAPVGNVNIIDYITIASAGDAIDFGDTTYAAWGAATFSSSTRGIVGGGTGPLNTMCFVTIATIGNAADFGDLSDQFRHTIGYASPTRGIMGTGDSPTVMLSNFDAITIASSGGGIDFGDICYGARAVSACCNTTRGVWMGGYRNSPAGGYVITEIDNTTIASGGQAIQFGTLPTTRSHGRSASTNIRAVNGGGNGSIKDVDSVEFASGGAAVAFSELNIGRSSPGALSDSHGGLGGF